MGDTLHRWGGEHGGVEESTERRHLHDKFHPHRCMGGVWGLKTENFTQFRNLNARRGVPLGDFHDISSICGRRHAGLGVKILGWFAQWMTELRGFKFRDTFSIKF